MNASTHRLVRIALTAAIAATLSTGCAKKGATSSAPDIVETKAIAEEGFIFGLPVVMNYGVMYE